MLNQFKRAIGCAIIRGQAQHKPGRLNYVRMTAAEAESVCRANHSESSWKPSQRGRTPSWYSANTPEGYSTWTLFQCHLTGFRVRSHICDHLNYWLRCRPTISRDISIQIESRAQFWKALLSGLKTISFVFKEARCWKVSHMFEVEQTRDDFVQKN